MGHAKIWNLGPFKIWIGLELSDKSPKPGPAYPGKECLPKQLLARPKDNNKKPDLAQFTKWEGLGLTFSSLVGPDLPTPRTKRK